MKEAREPPILEVRGLSMRFGGLAALTSVDLAVAQGEICSIIGPNGAGKTTLFNCISGVTHPTSGRILIAGRDVRKSPSWRVAASAIAVGLITAIAASALAWNVNGLWRATIRRPMHFSGRDFSYREMLNGAVHYFRGDLAVERQTGGRWAVVTADGRELLATAASRDEAERLRQTYDSASRGEQDNRTAPEARRELLAAVEAKRTHTRRWSLVALLGGFTLGSIGALSVWNRARWTADRVAASGVARTFQNLRLFKRMTIVENVLVALEAGTQAHARGDALNEARRLLELVGLAALADRRAGELAYGDARRLEIARALASHPRLLLLDEPAAGMNATETASLMELVRQIRASGITILLVEHEMDLVMNISDRVVVLDYGRKIAEGPPGVVRHNPAVIEAYLGAGN